MLDDSLFVSATVHERDVELPDGKKHKLYFKEVPATEWRRFAMAERSDDEDARVNSVVILITSSLVNADGTPGITFERASMLKPAPMNAIFSAVLEVNGQGGQKKASKPGAKSASGTS